MMAALVRERGLVLTNGTVGQCRIANLAMVVIADRMTNGWSRKLQVALGQDGR